MNAAKRKRDKFNSILIKLLAIMIKDQPNKYLVVTVQAKVNKANHLHFKNKRQFY